jgi:hypothetical protein
MQNDNPTASKPVPTKPAAPPARAERLDQGEPAVPVKRIVFQSPTDCLGDSNARDALIATDRAQVLDQVGKRRSGVAAWLIDYLPRLQHCRITYYPPGNKPEAFRMIPIAAVKAWDPIA